MKTAKIFRSGNSQAVRIPKESQLEGDEVEIQKKRDSLVLRPKKKSWASLVESLDMFTKRLHGQRTETAAYSIKKKAVFILKGPLQVSDCIIY